MIILIMIGEAFIALSQWFNTAYTNLSGIPIIGGFLAQPFEWAASECLHIADHLADFSFWLDDMFDAVVAAAGSVINIVYESLNLGDVYDAIAGVTNPILAQIWAVLSPLETYVHNIATDISRGFAAIPQLLFDGLEKLTLTFFDGFELISGNIFGIIMDAYTNTRDLVENWVDYVWAALGLSGEFLIDLHGNFAARVGEVVFGPLMTADDWLMSKMGIIKEYVIGNISEFADTILEAIFDTLEEHMDKWSGRIMKIIEKFMEHI